MIFIKNLLIPDMLGLVVERAFYLHALQQENRRLLQTQTHSPITGIITRDPGIVKVCRNVEKVAPSDATVILLGESGTGKEILARALHQSSARQGKALHGYQLRGNSRKRFWKVNCSAMKRAPIPEPSKQTLGKIELAHEGTFFLDEVGDLPMALQAKLLRFLQERVIERVGGRKGDSG